MVCPITQGDHNHQLGHCGNDHQLLPESVLKKGEETSRLANVMTVVQHRLCNYYEMKYHNNTANLMKLASQ